MTARGARGFTLIEVLVALAVLAIALSAIIKTMSANTLNSIYLRDRTLAQWVALNKITELQIGQDWPSPGKSDGSTVMGNHEWFWEAEIKTTPDKDVDTITLRVRDKHDAENPVSTLQAYIGRVR
jgi:general secretion pathway protein I